MSDFIQNGQKAVNIACPKCGHPKTTLKRYLKFETLFMIPLYIEKKEYTLFCENCHTESEPENLPVLSEAQKKMKAPWYTYSGLTLTLIGGLVWGGYHWKGLREIDTFKENPVCDVRFIYKLEEDETPYSYGRIETVSDQSVTLRLGTFMMSKEDMAYDKLRKDEEKYWEESAIEMDKGAFKDLKIKKTYKMGGIKK